MHLVLTCTPLSAQYDAQTLPVVVSVWLNQAQPVAPACSASRFYERSETSDPSEIANLVLALVPDNVQPNFPLQIFNKHVSPPVSTGSITQITEG